tara:strand:- start:148 stop:636 length:489 start_codon:yes stop_codon:yes gene_type:complete
MKLIYYILLLLIKTNQFEILVPKQNTKVIIHLEKFNEKYNLLHIGISFKRNFKTIRYDYRPFCENEPYNYETTNINRLNPRDIFPDTHLLNNLEMSDKIKKKDIFWGETNKTLEEIEEYEKTLHKKYILGINDCRHYVNKFTDWVLHKPTPIWKLNNLWNNY